MSGSRKSLKRATIFNPRASNEWSKDGLKFGQKMLEKMGWKQGQGIGLNNQGITKNIKVRLKLDIKGLGYQIKEDQWLEIRTEFSELLSQLSQGVEDEDGALNKGKKSLEAVSQSSKTRVHYHKFTHGKDIARYKKEDLIGILGKKEKNELDVLENKEFIQSGNMDEYFKSKKRKLENGDLNLPCADSTQARNILDQNSVDSKSVEKKKKLENGDLNLPSVNSSQVGDIVNLSSTDNFDNEKKSCDSIANYISNFEKNEEELLNKYREKYKKKYSISSSDIKVYEDDFDGRKLDYKKSKSGDTSVIEIKDSKNMSKAQKIVAKVRLLKSIKGTAATHDFAGSNLTSISGYGSEIC